MVLHFWATKEQLTFLQSQVDKFLEKQKQKKLGLFWPSLHSTWFACWPASNPDNPLPIDKEDLDTYQKEKGESITQQKKVRTPVTLSLPVTKVY